MHPSHPPSGRLTALGTQLIEIHHWLREELARLRASLDTPDGGSVALTRELRAHCAGFCAALDRHHTGEDGGAFQALAEQAPELRPVLAELSADHRIVADLLRRIDALLAEAADGRSVRAELDGLAALLESHFGYEERKIVAALNRLGGDPVELLGVTPPGNGDPFERTETA
ncbi:hemerythrin domain-containing protein [Micromonospora sp. CA-244673]|uniref:hemerythrin domain-containing protein n=1 Tax=Micromonospora sp. CA-244673 TaxID=3239958 RepID=UPI003D908586